MTVTDLAPWRRPEPSYDHHPVVAYPPPRPADPGPSGNNLRLLALGAAAVTGGWHTSPAPPAARAVTAPAQWRPAGYAPARQAQNAAGRAPRAVTWSLPPPPVSRPAIPAGSFQVTAPAPPGSELDFDINFDPPPEAAGTGLQATNADGSWVVHPLSLIHRGSVIGDEGPVNEAFLSTPVVHLMAGQAYALASPIVIPNGATLYLNRAALDRTMIHAGEGATVYD